MRLFSSPLPIVAGLAAASLLAACSGEASSKETVAEEVAASNTSNSKAKAGNPDDPSHVQATDMVLGDADAPVTVIEYASTTCPHCATFHKQIFPEIKKEFVDTGKVKFVFREFPTSPARLAIATSVLARCAADKGGSDAYFLVLGSLFSQQKGWLLGDDTKGELLKISAQAGMDEAAFEACLQRQEFIDLIQANTQTAVETFNISGTPSFVVDGEKVSAGSAEDFSKKLQAAYEKATSSD